MWLLMKGQPCKKQNDQHVRKRLTSDGPANTAATTVTTGSDSLEQRWGQIDAASVAFTTGASVVDNTLDSLSLVRDVDGLAAERVVVGVGAVVHGKARHSDERLAVVTGVTARAETDLGVVPGDVTGAAGENIAGGGGGWGRGRGRGGRDICWLRSGLGCGGGFRFRFWFRFRRGRGWNVGVGWSWRDRVGDNSYGRGRSLDVWDGRRGLLLVVLSEIARAGQARGLAALVEVDSGGGPLGSNDDFGFLVASLDGASKSQGGEGEKSKGLHCT